MFRIYERSISINYEWKIIWRMLWPFLLKQPISCSRKLAFTFQAGRVDRSDLLNKEKEEAVTARLRRDRDTYRRQFV